MASLASPTGFRPWKSHPRESVAAAILLVTGAVALAGASWATPTFREQASAAATGQAQVAPPRVDPLVGALRDIAPDEAAARNRDIPLSALPNPAAAPFAFKARNPADLERAVECLSSAIYYEAGQEDEAGQRAVAQVVLNRVRHPAFPATVCGVVYEGSTRPTGCQFTFTCDGSLARQPMASAWARTRRIAAEALGGAVYAPVGQATHYHANYVLPYWATTLAKTAVEGAHLFYRWSGAWGTPGAFRQPYAGREPAPSALRRAALAVPHDLPSQLATAAEGELPPGVTVATETGKDRKVIAKFRPEARAASDKAVVIPYAERADASANLRYALEGEQSGSEQSAFGRLDRQSEERQSPAS